MKFRMPVLAVKNIEKSKAFYKTVFNQEIEFDFGKNITFKSGFALQEDFAWLVDVENETVIEKSNNMELYFESDNFDQDVEKLRKADGIKLLHDVKTHSWHQRVIRVYDPDHHIIELGEDMECVIIRLLKEWKDVKKVSEMTQYPISEVERNFENYHEKNIATSGELRL